MTSTAEYLVIGGGLAGSMAAVRLAAAGREVALLEKEREPRHKVCGEFLSHEAVEYLRAAGVDALQMGAATLRCVRLAVGDAVAEARLPFPALSLSRKALDEAMLARAEAGGCNVVRGAHVERISGSENAWYVQTRDGETWLARNLFLATGKHDVSGSGRSGSLQRDLVGFKLHWQLARDRAEALREHIELFLFAGGYGGLSLVENDAANLCLVAKHDEVKQCGGWSGLLQSIQAQNRHIAHRLKGATPLWERPLAIYPIPYGFVAREHGGMWRLGDQAAVIPSFTGDGMSIALHSGAQAARMALDSRSPSEYLRIVKRDVRRSMALSIWLSRTMVTASGRGTAKIALRLLPQAMGWIAQSTRLPRRAMVLDSES